MIIDARHNMVKDVNPAYADLTIEQQQQMPLLAKVPGLQVDVKKLNWHLQNVVKQYKPVGTLGQTVLLKSLHG